MITNERQYRITKAQESRFRKAVDAFDIDEVTKRIGSNVLAKAELDALKSELDVLSDQIREYEALKSGAVTELTADTFDELPGILIRARIAKGLTQSQLAKKLGVKEQQIQRYESEEYASASSRRVNEVANALNINIQTKAQLEPEHPIQISMGEKGFEWDRFPIKEMIDWKWFEGFSGMLDDTDDGLELPDNYLLSTYVNTAMPSRQPALLRHTARDSTKINPYAQLAWQCRILHLAMEAHLESSYSRELITDEWLHALARESRHDDGPRRAKEKLAEVGIRLVLERHLPQTYLDGGAFLLPDGSPVIGMSLRYDRLDNFWFVLFHELIHVIRHLSEKLPGIVDRLSPEPEQNNIDIGDADPKLDELEREADAMALSALIPDDAWEVALARFLRTEESVISFAKDQKIHPSIVAGRIRHEARDWVILSNLIGKGEVRRQFPDVKFSSKEG